MQEINLYLLQYLNWLSDNDFIQIFVKIFVDFPIFIIPIFLLWFWLKYTYSNKSLTTEDSSTLQKKEWLMFITYWIILWITVSLLIQQIVHIDRPEEYLSLDNLLMKHLPDASFPSDHATVWMAFLFWVFFAWYKKYFFIFLLPMTFMVISRVIAWVHWPFDILAGTVVWLVSSYIVFSQVSKIKLVKTFNLWIIKILKYIKL